MVSKNNSCSAFFIQALHSVEILTIFKNCDQKITGLFYSKRLSKTLLIYPAVAQYQETNYQVKRAENETNGYMDGFLGLAGPLTSVIKDLAGQKT